MATNNLDAIFPRARNREDDVVVQDVYDELVVYDLERHEVHSLNATAARIWHLSDGETTPEAMAVHLVNELHVPFDQAKSMVWLALDRLETAHLLENKVQRPPTYERITRRQVLKGMAIAAIVPVVYSISAPTAYAQFTNVEVPLSCLRKQADIGLACANTQVAPNCFALGDCYNNDSCHSNSHTRRNVTCTECFSSGGQSWKVYFPIQISCL